jgi:hypothetical protein
VFLLELETELQALCQVTDATTSYVRARGEHLEECLLDVPEHFRDVVENGVHRGAAVALTAAQVQSGHELRFLIGFPKGEGAADHERLVEDFDEATDGITAEVPTEEVILKAL